MDNMTWRRESGLLYGVTRLFLYKEAIYKQDHAWNMRLPLSAT